MGARNRSVIACCFLLATLGSGCAAIASQLAYFSHEAEFDGGPWGTLYLGTNLDFQLAVNGGFCCINGPSALGHTMGIVDLPFSLALDTALLPITIGQTLALAVRRRGEGDNVEDRFLDDTR